MALYAAKAYLMAAVTRVTITSCIWHVGSQINKAQSEYKHSLTFCVCRYVVIAMKSVHGLQIRPTEHN